jgi:hypothetical protein
MKKLAILFVAAILSSTAFSQGSLDNEFYFRGGISTPSWKQYGGTKSDWELWTRKGLNFELGSIFMLKSIPMADGMALGINADYLSIYWHQFTLEEAGFRSDVVNLRFDSKIGPSFSYSPVERLVFDAYVKADISWVTATVITADFISDEEEGYGDVLAVGLSTGFNVRYSVLMLGFEFNTINPKLLSVDADAEDDDYFGNLNDENSDKSPLPSINFTIGLSF